MRNKDGVLGVDVGSTSVKVVQTRKHGTGYAITAAAFADIPSTQNEDANERTKSVLQAVSSCLDDLQTQSPYAVSGVCGPEVAVRGFSFPPLAREELDGAVQLEASQVCPFMVEEAVVDYHVVSHHENGVEGILVAATRDCVQAKREVIKHSSLQNVLMDVDGLAVLNCFTGGRAYSGPATALFNIGGRFTNSVIIDEEGIPVVRDVCRGAESIIARTAADTDLTDAQVRAYLFGDGQEGMDELIAPVLERACGELLSEMNNTLRYYAARDDEGVVEQIFLTGGFARGRGVGETLDAHLPGQVRVWNPMEHYPCEGDKRSRTVLEQKAGLFAVAIGLALRTF